MAGPQGSGETAEFDDVEMISGIEMIHNIGGGIACLDNLLAHHAAGNIHNQSKIIWQIT